MSDLSIQEQINQLKQKQNEAAISGLPNAEQLIATLETSIMSLEQEQEGTLNAGMSAQNIGRSFVNAGVRSGASMIDFGIDAINMLDFRGPLRDENGNLQRDDLGKPLERGPLIPFRATQFLPEMGIERSREILGEEHKNLALAIDHGMDMALFAAPTGGMISLFAGGLSKIPSMRKFAEPFKHLSIKDEVVFAATGGFAGGYFGDGETPSFVAEIAVPLGITTGIPTAKEVASKFIKQLRGSDVSNEVAMRLLNQALDDSGLTLEEAVKRYEQLGDEAMLVDTDDAFRRLARLARGEGLDESGTVRRLRLRTEGDLENPLTTGRLGRLNQDVGEYLGTLDGDSYILQAKAAKKEEIDRLYDQARTSNSGALPQELVDILAEDSSAMRRANDQAFENQLNATGSNDFEHQFDYINAVKQALDDQIAAITSGIDPTSTQANQVRSLLALKNRLTAAADNAFPGYLDARNAFAGVAELQNKVEMGRNIYGRGMDADTLELAKQSWSKSELEAFKVGARDAIIDLMANSPSSGAMQNRIMRTPEIAQRLKVVLGDDYDSFIKAIEREGEFAKTHRTIQGNSQTFEKFADATRMHHSVSNIINASYNPLAQMQMFTQTISNLAQENSKENYRRGLQMANDILMNSDLSPKAVREALTRGEVRSLVAPLAISIFGAKSIPENVLNIIRQPARTVSISQVAQMASRERDAMEEEFERNQTRERTNDLLTNRL